MINVIFVHGTSIRRDGYDQLYNQVQEALLGGSGRNDIKVWPCYWGDLGAELHGGKSIPDYDKTKHPGKAVDHTPYDTALWSILLRTPLYELQMLSLQPPRASGGFGAPAGKALLDQFKTLTVSPELVAPLQLTPELMAAARDLIVADGAIIGMIQKAQKPLADYRFALARSVIAFAAQNSDLLSSGALSEEWLISSPNEQRDLVVRSIVDLIGGPEGVPSDWLRRVGESIVKTVWQVAKPLVPELATEFVFLPNRGDISDPASKFFADIFKYQGNGAQMREVLVTAIQAIPGGEEKPEPKEETTFGDGAQQHPGDNDNEEKPEAKKETTTLLAHSLGGIICVDTLIRNPDAFPHVKQLITFGSQSPLFYEWDALVSLRYGEPIPSGFPC